MIDPIITVEKLYKKYSRNAQNHLGYGMRDLLNEIAGKHNRELRKDEFYAVNDVSFQLYPGDTVAIIGRNGSGKTTIMKMLNGLIKPDGGRISIGGRVQALINLGAGFSQRLSGRENIFNSASLMGLNHTETTALLDAIIDFSELEDFIDSPVGTYSSGMTARLGFSVAVHLSPDVLLIDEVLSVGDYSFQNKCFIRMEELKKSGVTIVFVSHSHASVIKLCERAVWIHDGCIRAQGPSLKTVQSYLDFMEHEDKLRHAKSINSKSVSIAPIRNEKDPEPEVDTSQEPNPIEEPKEPVDPIEEDPEFLLAISWPRSDSSEITLPADEEKFHIGGWYKASSEKEISLLINGKRTGISKVERPDVTEKYPDAPYVTGFTALEHRDNLKPENTVELLIDQQLCWSKTLHVKYDTIVPNVNEARDSIYGPLYPVPRDVDNIECKILIDGTEVDTIPIHSQVTIRFGFRLKRKIRRLESTLNFHRKDGLRVAAIATMADARFADVSHGHVICDVHIPDFDFLPGPYVITMPIAEGRSYLWRDIVKEFYVEGGGQLYSGIKDITHTYEIRVK